MVVVPTSRNMGAIIVSPSLVPLAHNRAPWAQLASAESSTRPDTIEITGREASPIGGRGLTREELERQRDGAILAGYEA